MLYLHDRMIENDHFFHIICNIDCLLKRHNNFGSSSIFNILTIFPVQFQYILRQFPDPAICIIPIFFLLSKALFKGSR